MDCLKTFTFHRECKHPAHWHLIFFSNLENKKVFKSCLYEQMNNIKLDNTSRYNASYTGGCTMAYIDIHIYSRCTDNKIRLKIPFFPLHICNPTQVKHCLVTFMQLNLLFTPVNPPAQRGKI